ncbi:MAG: preprotein translocase subunit YajC [Myxococcota bacterium]
MFLTALSLLLWFQPDPTGLPDSLPGAGSSAGSAPPLADGLGQFGLIALFSVLLYFMLIRPQRKQQKEREQMLGSLKKGMTIRTTGGIRGEITKIESSEITLQIADRVRVNVLRSAVAGPADNADGGSGKTSDTSKDAQAPKTEDSKPSGDSSSKKSSASQNIDGDKDMPGKTANREASSQDSQAAYLNVNRIEQQV